MQLDHSDTPKQAVIYTRNCQLKQVGTAYSIQAQIAMCRAYCAEHGYTLSEDQVYGDPREVTVDPDRPELTRLSTSMQRGCIDALVIASLERFTRDVKASAMLTEQLKAIDLETETAEETQSEQE